MANDLSAERFKIILPINHPARVFSAMLGDFGAFRWKTLSPMVTEFHRTVICCFAEALICSLSANQSSR
ncbi:hypothetical protein DCC62_08555 [candidate division KSB1 bacterium]|nr:MAG: hypothetical protein DCC62_08555 [candidate division KSB1 bacterium]